MRSRWTYRIPGSVLAISAGVLAWTALGSRETLLLQGSFHSVAHKGTGEARVVSIAGGRFALRLHNVKTYPAPDLDVCLVAVPDAEDNDTVRQAGFVCVGSFDAKAESKVFAVPGSVNLEKYRAVTIWSRRYQVNFTTAPLQ